MKRIGYFFRPPHISPEDWANRPRRIARPRAKAAPAAAGAAAAVPDDAAAWFDPVTVATLEAMFPARDQWAKWAERAARNGLIGARVGRGKFNPYAAGKWFLTQGEPGWTEARLYRVLGKNLPARSTDKRELLGLVADE